MWRYSSPLLRLTWSLGVNTGFGGSANVRTTDLRGLQVSLIQHTQSGIISKLDATEQGHDEFGRHVMPHVVSIFQGHLFRCLV